MKTYRTAKVVLIDSTGKILLLRRGATHPTQASHMDLPGGIIEDREDPARALLRELDEETGLQIEAEKIKLAYSETEVHEGQNAVRLVYVARLFEPAKQVTLSWEHDAFQWAAIAQAVEALPAKNYKRRALAYLIEQHILEDL